MANLKIPEFWYGRGKILVKKKDNLVHTYEKFENP